MNACDGEVLIKFFEIDGISVRAFERVMMQHRRVFVHTHTHTHTNVHNNFCEKEKEKNIITCTTGRHYSNNIAITALASYVPHIVRRESSFCVVSKNR
jgi:hypothetical protein